MAEETAVTQQMRDAIGIESESRTYDVEKGAIIKFAEAIGDANPLYNDEPAARSSRFGGITAPPTFLRSMSPGPMKAEVSSPYSANLDGGSEWEYFEPVRPGDRISVTGLVSGITERKGRLGNMMFIVRETRYVNQFGTLAAVQRSTGISYNAPSGGS